MSDRFSADPAAVLADFERRARRFETPCGEGSLVWRAWGSGPPLLLAHGAQGAWVHWIRNIDALAAQRTVLALDLPGWGDSALPPQQDHRTVANVVAAGLRQLRVEAGIELPIDAVGFSFGGVAMGHLAADHPEIVRQVVVVDAGGLGTPTGPIRLQRVRGLEGEARRQRLRENLLGFMLHAPASVDDLALHIQSIYPGKGRFDAMPFVMPDGLLRALPNITVPFNAIWGEFDVPHPAVPQEPVLRQFHPGMQFITIRAAGHWAMYERPAEFNRALLELLDRPIARETRSR